LERGGEDYALREKTFKKKESTSQKEEKVIRR